ncbi:MAG: SpoIIE family protein phosphatase [Bacteroidetes bacterium]|nr:SpoIIE family protein phosphatase [Bacteroidota bacterium]
MFVFIACFCNTSKFFAQADTLSVQQKIDEARNILINNPTKSKSIAFEAYRLAQVSNNKRLIAYSLNTIGSSYYFLLNFDSTVYFHLLAIEIQEEIHDELGLGRSLTNLGNSYLDQRLNDKAIQYFLKAESKFIKTKYNIGLSKLYNSMGNLFNSINDYKNSIVYYKKGIELSEKMKDNSFNYALSINLANVYSSINKPADAMELYLNTYQKVKLDSNYVYFLMICNNICQQYIDMNEFEKAKKYSNEAIEMIKIHDFEDYLKINSYSNYAALLEREGKYDVAKKYIDSALMLLQFTSDVNKNIALKKQLSQILFVSGNFDGAYSKLMEAYNLKDTMYQNNLSEKLSELNTIHEVEKKESQIQLLSDAQRKQKTINYLLIGVACISFVAITILISSYRRKKKDNEIILQQKNEVITKNKLVEEKQKEILDSINYAKRIQYALLASDKLLKENLPEYFLFFKPKDVVSGDFYWGASTGSTTNKRFALVTADSTGHGVPGSIMSMLNISCLNETINADKLVEAADILNATRKKIINHLSNDGSAEGGKDGMDCSVLVFDFQNLKLQIAAANNPVWIVREIINDKLEILNENIENPFKIYNSTFSIYDVKPDKMPVGKHDKQDIPFTLHEVDIQKGDIVYTLTDGFQDQFGGEKGKKYMIKNLRELIVSNAHLPMQVQKQLLEATFNKWKGTNEQVDDVTVVGIKV